MCRPKRRLRLTLRGAALASLGSLSALRLLRLDLDASCSAPRALLALGALRRLEALRLGYVWWSEVDVELLAELHEAFAKLPLRRVAVVCPQDPELGALETAAQALLGEAVEDFLVTEAWDQEAMVLWELLEVLGHCRSLRRVVLLGDLPMSFDAMSFERALRRCSQSLKGLPDVLVNCPSGLKAMLSF